MNVTIWQHHARANVGSLANFHQACAVHILMQQPRPRYRIYQAQHASGRCATFREVLPENDLKRWVKSEFYSLL